MEAGTWSQEGRELRRRSRRRGSFIWSWSLAAAQVTHVSLCPSLSLRGDQLAGVSATMIQNVGNHLRRVCRVGWGWIGGKGEGTGGWESQKRIEVSILSQKFYISSLIFHGPFSNSLLEGEITGPLGWFIISSNPQTSPRGH